ncbi:hypothetical protein [Absidia glauca]|uniref:Ndc10 domain-containing protein n=1 Tax=Absidia glauca TaxID=4829 RepID=A0A163L196_ABSGL|nr:hypothetical protein [Absidia glauca]
MSCILFHVEFEYELSSSVSSYNHLELQSHRNGVTLLIKELIGKAVSSPGVRSNKKSHINCGSSAGMACNVCANIDQIRRQGRWNNTTMNGAYLTNLPRELVQSMAGFPTYGRFFYLARTALNPPTSLCKKLFPAIGE